jgi:hypothetical protein
LIRTSVRPRRVDAHSLLQPTSLESLQMYSCEYRAMHTARLCSTHHSRCTAVRTIQFCISGRSSAAIRTPATGTYRWYFSSILVGCCGTGRIAPQIRYSNRTQESVGSVFTATPPAAAAQGPRGGRGCPACTRPRSPCTFQPASNTCNGSLT